MFTSPLFDFLKHTHTRLASSCSLSFYFYSIKIDSILILKIKFKWLQFWTKKKYITQKSSSSSNKKSILIFCFVCYFGYFSATNRNKKKIGVALKIAKIFILFLFQMDITEKNFVSVSKYNLEYLREIQMNLLKNLTKLIRFNIRLFSTRITPILFYFPSFCIS